MTDEQNYKWKVRKVRPWNTNPSWGVKRPGGQDTGRSYWDSWEDALKYANDDKRDEVF